MARLLVRLKLRLLANRARTSLAVALGLGLGALFGLSTAAIAATGLVASATTKSWPDVVVGAFAVAWLGWLVLPILTFSTDDTLDPRHFSLFPLRPGELLPGLLAAGVVGVGGIATVLAASGAAVGAVRASGAVTPGLVGLAAVVVLVAACVAGSRALVTLLADLLASRRGRDLTTLGGLLVLLVVVAAPQLVQVPGAEVGFGWLDQGTVDAVVGAAKWTPGGAAGAAIGAAVASQWAMAAGWLGVAVAWTGLFMLVWAVGLGRLRGRPPTQTSRAGGASRLYPRALAWLPRNRTTAVTVRFLRMVARDGRARNPMLSQVMFMVPALAVAIPTISGTSAPLFAVLACVSFGLVANTQVGLDGPALWQHHVVGDDPRSDLLGRDLAFALLALPLAAVAAVVLGAVFQAWRMVPVALVLAPAVLAAMLGVANAAAVVTAQPVPEDPSSGFSSRPTGTGCVQGLLGLLVVIIQGVTLLPVVVGMALVDTPGAKLGVAVAGCLWGAAVFTFGTRFAVSRAVGRGPELLAAIDPRT